MNRWKNRLICLAPDDGQGAGNGGDGGVDVVAKLQAMIDKRDGDTNAMALMLFQENYQLREKNRQLQAQLPAEDAVVLTGDQAAAWEAYQALGAPAELQQAIQERDQAQGDLGKLRRNAMLREAA